MKNSITMQQFVYMSRLLHAVNKVIHTFLHVVNTVIHPFLHAVNKVIHPFLHVVNTVIYLLIVCSTLTDSWTTMKTNSKWYHITLLACLFLHVEETSSFTFRRLWACRKSHNGPKLQFHYVFIVVCAIRIFSERSLILEHFHRDISSVLSKSWSIFTKIMALDFNWTSSIYIFKEPWL